MDMKTGGHRNMKEEKKMIYSNITFEMKPFRYDLKFSTRITLVRGDSATGKTYLYQLLEDVRMTEQYKEIRMFNYKSVDFHENLKNCRNKFIVIDNADILINDDDRKFINFEISNQYLLFMRNCDGLNLTADSFTVLNEDNNSISLMKEVQKL